MEIPATTLAIFAVFAVMGLVGVIAIEVISTPQEATASGCKSGVPFNASKGRCFGH